MATTKNKKNETKKTPNTNNSKVYKEKKTSNKSSKKENDKINIINSDDDSDNNIGIKVEIIDEQPINVVENITDTENNNSIQSDFDIIQSITTYAELPEIGNTEPEQPTEPEQESTTTETEQPSTPLDLEKTFVCKKGSSFMEGSVLISIDDTNIKRVDEKTFSISGNINGTTPFQVPFECHDKEEADYFFDELLEYEKNPENFIKGESNVSEGTTEAPIESKNFDGVTVDSGNIDDLINSIKTTANIEPNNNIQTPIQHQQGGVNTGSSAMDMSSILNNNMLGQMTVYGKSIADHINGSFQATHWGGMPLAMANDFLNSCSKDYSYKFIKESNGYSLIVSKDGFDVRIPESSSEFLKISE